jgi:methylated-DNA-[protein]-cysteine S-methyltransferase
MDSKIGPLYLVANADVLKGVFWEKQEAPFIQDFKECDVLKEAVRQISDYLEGRRQGFSLRIEPAGTDFQRRVWRELSRIPYGETVSYAELARRAGKEKAVRAVGTANGKNPLCLVIPCHRVIASDGTLGGYSGGLERKKLLLAMEREFGGVTRR